MAHQIRLVCLLLSAVLIVAGCTEQKEKRQAELIQNDWLYQLQNAEPEKIADSGYTWAVLDPTGEGSEDTRYSRDEIAKMKESGMTVLAYLSIGEASAYLAYWKKEWGAEKNGVLKVKEEAPLWLGREPNPSWPESINVRYWDEAWWKLLEPELAKIKEQGFSGVYLDIVDGYLYWGDASTFAKEQRLVEDPATEEEAAKRMMDLVKRISSYMKKDEPNFQVFPQNAETILAYDDDGSYINAIDGIGVEDLWFDEEQRQTDTEERLPYLKTIQNAGKTVLAADYVASSDSKSEQEVIEYLKLCKEQKFQCLAAYHDRELAALIPKERWSAD
ncbi:MJ1477/TM1410 family putative glycoside hydrolase [Planococcus sp. YIM B11945]|uniref:MJ1477/TM1410 family putative glycoside hydrolase n=1 Tax=Planococcus sp. YIM B11945 TaxID=3435410 RepID=UPI003D7E26D8